MKQIRLMKWLLEVDLYKTEKFYTKDIEICDCLYCRNFIEASKHFNPAIIEVFTGLGINLSKPSHLSEFGEQEDGLRLILGELSSKWEISRRRILC
ncbi:hypothetical protein MKY30_08150 [Oceanobacillus sp. FSL W8-0428]|uniref:Uncharacterized protein n=2 Tax=Oceanobacillus sojae TaxID=582851 RepID=A0A511ZQS5_9BACI|nr:hypothetical protein [Oceanobacillus sojae]GEN89800.1 hypothetical protein OSO01_45390 [Oceanobacillus sojae]